MKSLPRPKIEIAITIIVVFLMAFLFCYSQKSSTFRHKIPSIIVALLCGTLIFFSSSLLFQLGADQFSLDNQLTLSESTDFERTQTMPIPVNLRIRQIKQFRHQLRLLRKKIYTVKQYRRHHTSQSKLPAKSLMNYQKDLTKKYHYKQRTIHFSLRRLYVQGCYYL